MSVSTTLANAMTGLSAAAKRAQVVSSNIANAHTESYGRRELIVSSQAVGGVRVEGVQRHADVSVIQNRRVAGASAAEAQAQQNFYTRMERSIGLPDTSGALSQQVSRLTSALISAVSTPDSDGTLRNVLAAAQGVSEHIRAVSMNIQTARSDADAEIAAQVDALNLALRQVKSLNAEITRVQAAGMEKPALVDQRQAVIDSISTIIPIRQYTRDNGQVALFTPAGGMLLDGQVAEIGFTPTAAVDPFMELGNGLSGLSLNGTEIDMGEGGLLSGGTLSAHFKIRDELAPELQAGLDSLTRNVIERFQDSGVDPTVVSGQAGLFTDDGLTFDGVNEVGISQRITVNASVDPSEGGALWRLRSGINALVPGDAGDGSTLLRMADAFERGAPASSVMFGPTARSVPGFFDEFSSFVGGKIQQTETEVAGNMAKFDIFHDAELRSGVDTDQEMQNLLQIETAYAANARVLQTVDQLLKTVLGI